MCYVNCLSYRELCTDCSLVSLQFSWVSSPILGLVFEGNQAQGAHPTTIREWRLDLTQQVTSHLLLILTRYKLHPFGFASLTCSSPHCFTSHFFCYPTIPIPSCCFLVLYTCASSHTNISFLPKGVLTCHVAVIEYFSFLVATPVLFCSASQTSHTCLYWGSHILKIHFSMAPSRFSLYVCPSDQADISKVGLTPRLSLETPLSNQPLFRNPTGRHGKFQNDGLNYS